MIREIREMGVWNFIGGLLALGGFWAAIYAGYVFIAAMRISQ